MFFSLLSICIWFRLVIGPAIRVIFFIVGIMQSCLLADEQVDIIPTIKKIKNTDIGHMIRRNRAILRYSFYSGRDILNIHPFITLSILMVETSYCTYMEAVTCVFQGVIKFVCKLFQLADIIITNSASDSTSNFTNFQVTLLHAIIPLF